MTTVANPYASPQAADLGNEASSAEVDAKIMTFSGRLGRLRLIAYGIISAFSVMFVGGIIAAVLMPTMPVVGGIVYAIALLFSAIFGFSLYVRRLHDLNQSGWWTLLIFLPFINLLLIIYLLFFPGTDGGNRYGPPVKPNSSGVIAAFVLSIFLGIAYIGIIAAVAIPAYQDYVERAQQMQ